MGSFVFFALAVSVGLWVAALPQKYGSIDNADARGGSGPAQAIDVNVESEFLINYFDKHPGYAETLND